MKVKFFGEPNMLVKTRKRVLFDNKIQFKPLFRFDSNGEYITDDEKLIEKLKIRFDHVEINDTIESSTTNENKEVDVIHSESKKEPLNKRKGGK